MKGLQDRCAEAVEKADRLAYLLENGINDMLTDAEARLEKSVGELVNDFTAKLKELQKEAMAKLDNVEEELRNRIDVQCSAVAEGCAAPDLVLTLVPVVSSSYSRNSRRFGWRWPSFVSAQRQSCLIASRSSKNELWRGSRRSLPT